MKKIYGLAALAAMITLASCSNNDEPVVGGGDVESVPGYMAVRIHNGSESTRAAFSYAPGDDAESKVTDGTFLLLDNSNNVVGYAQDVEFSNGTVATTPGNIESTAKYQYVTVTMKTGKTNSDCAKVVTVLNAKGHVVDADNNTTLSDVLVACTNLSGIKDVTNALGATTAGSFIMSTSVYQKDNTDIYANPCTVYATAAEAEAATEVTQIYVERQAAKVVATFTTGITVDGVAINGENDPIKNFKILGDDEDTEYQVVVTGVNLVYVPTKSWTVKNIDTKTNWPSNWAADYADFRSHWAYTNLAATDIVSKAWNAFNMEDIAAPTDDDENATVKGKKVYTLENTYSDKATKVVMTAKIQKKGADDTAWSDATFYYYAGEGGVLYDETSIKNRILNGYQEKGYKVKNGETISDFDADWISFTQAANPTNNYAGYAVLTLPEGATVTDAAGNEIKGVSAESLNTALAAKEIWKYDGGAMFYYADITTLGQAGVIRNHVYNVKLNSFTGLGTAMFNKTSNIIPTKPNEDPTDGDNVWTFKADINVLQWAVSEQTVDFNWTPSTSTED